MAEQLANVDRTMALFERPAMGVQDETAFAAVKQAIAERFAARMWKSFCALWNRARCASASLSGAGKRQAGRRHRR
jgi:hypothetical protein